jgi:hypothetical protein
MDEKARAADRAAAVNAPAVRAVGYPRQRGIDLGKLGRRVRKLRDVHAALGLGGRIVVGVIGAARHSGLVVPLLAVAVQARLERRHDFATQEAQPSAELLELGLRQFTWCCLFIHV